MNKFLKEHNLIKKHNNINDFIRHNKKTGFQCFNTRNKCYKIAIDTMLYAHKFKYSFNNYTNPIIYGFTNQIVNFLSNRIIPIYVFDGVAPSEKSDVIKSRNNRKNRIEGKIQKLKLEVNIENNQKQIDILNKKIHSLNRSNIQITRTDINNLLDLIKYFGIPYIRARGEADALIGILYENNTIDVCLSEDMDILVFGCKKMIKFQKKQIYEYDLNFILNKLNITNDQYMNMCILFGCDYLKPLIKTSPIEIYNNIYYSTVQSLIKNSIPDNYYYKKYIGDFDKAKKVFLNSRNNEEIRKYNFQIKKKNK